MHTNISDNTVPAENQIPRGQFVSFEGNSLNGIRILFIGNSITWHSPRKEIGWFNNCGMAASSKEKDYVHLLMKKVSEIDSDASFCIAQLAEWERNYWDESVLSKYYSNVLEYHPDVIIVRVAENVPGDKLSEYPFAMYYEKMLNFFNREKNKKMILTTSFWKSKERDDAILFAAEKYGYTAVDLGSLGEIDEMKAIGQYEHSGVALHPGDKGMEAIANAIWTELESIIKNKTDKV